MMEERRIDYAGEYGEIHRNHKRFPGFSLKAYLEPIAALVAEHEAKTLLDFGCGKARGYFERNYHEAWGGIMPALYDIGVPEFSRKPVGPFDGVICTDMLEHIAEADVISVLGELFGYVAPGGFLFVGISCRPSRKTLSDGRDVHLTVQPPRWWIDQLKIAGGMSDGRVHIVAHWDIAGHFDEPETPWDNAA